LTGLNVMMKMIGGKEIEIYSSPGTMLCSYCSNMDYYETCFMVIL
jgi:hypothetical protein